MEWQIVEKNNNLVITPTLKIQIKVNNLVFDEANKKIDITVDDKQTRVKLNEIDDRITMLLGSLQKAQSVDSYSIMRLSLIYRNRRYLTTCSHVECIPVTIYDLNKHNSFACTIHCNLIIKGKGSFYPSWHMKDVKILN